MTAIRDVLARGTSVSFEFFPPKTEAAALTLGRTIAELEPLNPSFVSVTYGAGGSTRERTRSVVRWVRKETNIVPMAHLTCVGHTRAEIAELLDDYADADVRNILALGGDPPADGPAPASDYTYALELVEQIKEHPGAFSVGVAAHPELHPRSPDRSSDRRYLAEKLRAADFAVSQFFFDVAHYTRMLEDLAELDCDKPVLPGIMPVTNAGQVQRMAELSGAEFPLWLAERIELAGDPDEVRRIGVDVATELARGLLEAGAPGIHLYTLNRSTATREVHARLGL